MAAEVAYLWATEQLLSPHGGDSCLANLLETTGGPHPSHQYVHPADAKSIDPNECAVGECHQ